MLALGRRSVVPQCRHCLRVQASAELRRTVLGTGEPAYVCKPPRYRCKELAAALKRARKKAA